MATAGLLATALACGGARGGARAPVAEDQRAKEFQVPPDRSLLYVYRNRGGIGATATNLSIKVNGQALGQLGGSTYVVVAVVPGSHVVTATSGGSGKGEEIVVTEPGRAYFVATGVDGAAMMGRAGRTKAWAHEVDAGEGRDDVLSAELVASKVQEISYDRNSVPTDEEAEEDEEAAEVEAAPPSPPAPASSEQGPTAPTEGELPPAEATDPLEPSEKQDHAKPE